MKKYIELRGYETADKNELNSMLVNMYSKINDTVAV